MNNSQRCRILFMGETVTLAHVARPFVLANSLDRDRFEIHFACDTPGNFVVKDAGHFQKWRLHSMPRVQFLHNLARGRPAFDRRTIEAYVGEDLQLLECIRPDLVVGDLRVSLAVSAAVANIPYAVLANAHYSPYTRRKKFPLPEIRLNRILGLHLVESMFHLTQSFQFSLHAKPLNSVRRRYGLEPLESLLNVFTQGDYCWYADLPEIAPTYPLPPEHAYLGPILWEPHNAFPDWWNELIPDRPLIYVTLGSSGCAKLLPRLLSLIAEMPVRAAVATAGRMEIPQPPPNVFVANYLPGIQVASRSQLVICNGGSATAYQALAAGVPVLGIATNLDQLLTMKGIERQGAGVLLRSSQATTRQLPKVLQKMLQDGSFRFHAQRLAADFSRFDAVQNFHIQLSRLLPQHFAKSV